MKPYNQDLISFIKKFEDIDFEDDDLFADLIAAALQTFNLADVERELANRYQIALTAVHRWANKASSPHPLLRRDAGGFLINKAKSLLIERIAGI